MDAVLHQLVERVRDAAARRVPLRICGGSSKSFHPNASQGTGMSCDTLDMRAFTGVLSYEPSELVISARAGTPLAEVEELLAAHGQYLPFEPPRFADTGTVGGMVATGLSGPARASVGAVRDFVLGVDIINGQGQCLRFGGQVMKNVAGYDVSRLMAGAWGQLGAITQVSLKVLPLPPAEATLRFDCNQGEALTWLNAWGAQPLPLNASCWMNGQLLVRLRGAKAAVQAACRTMGGNLVTRLDDWQACRDQSLPWFSVNDAQRAEQSLWRLSLPQTTGPLALPAGMVAPLIEWHGGQRWVWATPSQEAALAALALQAGGSATVFKTAHAYREEGARDGVSAHAGAYVGTDATKADNALVTIHRRLKQAFDPDGIFNPATALP